MKITVNIDCTPEEARTFFGLPDVQPLQKAMMAELEERMRANLNAMDPESLFKSWFPTGVQNLEQLQNMFWSQMQAAAGGRKKSDDGDGA